MRWIGWAVLMLAAGAALAQAERPEVPRHADPVVQGVQDHLNRLCERHDARLAAIRTPEQLRAELDASRKRLLKLLDLDLEKKRSAPRVRVVGSQKYPGYTIERVVVETGPGVPVPCNVYVPAGGGARKPALLVPHGHSGRDRPVYLNGYQRLAKAGFVVLAKDGWGKQERRATGHGPEGGQLFLTGGSLMALELWDNVRLVDYLLSRTDVDGERLGMVGLSGGGTQTLYTMAIEPRLKAGSPTCAVTTYRSDLADTTMCVCELLTDVLTVGDHGLFLAMAYPRPLLVVNGTQDAIFPIAGARAAVRQARRLYAVGGHEARVRLEEFNIGHDWSDPMLTLQIAWFREQFGLEPLPDPALGDGPVDAETLKCLPGGELPKDAVTLDSLNRKRMKQAGSPGPSAAEIIRERWSGEPDLPKNLATATLEPDPRRLFRRWRWSWASGLGGQITARVTAPFDPRGVKPRVVVRLDRDRQVPPLEQLYWDDQIRTAATVVDFDYTGKGLSPVQEGQVGSALVCAGRSLLAERARDLLVLLRVLEREKHLGPETELTLVGHGFDGVLLLAAAPLLPERARLVLDETPITYREGAEIDFRTPLLLAPPVHWTILPGVAQGRDLSDLLAEAHPRHVLLLHPLDSAQQRMSRAEVARLLPSRSGRGAVEALAREVPRHRALAALAGEVRRSETTGR